MTITCPNHEKHWIFFRTAADLTRQCNRIVGTGLVVTIRGCCNTETLAGVPARLDFTFRKNCVLGPDRLRELRKLFHDNAESLVYVNGITFSSAMCRRTFLPYETDRVELRTICDLIYCLGSSGIRFAQLAVILTTHEVLVAEDWHCRFLGTLIRAFGLNVNEFRFSANFQNDLLGDASVDCIIDSLHEAWVRAPMAPVTKKQRICLWSDNFLDFASIAGVRRLCCMEFCTGLVSSEFGYPGERGLEVLAVAVAVPGPVPPSKELRLHVRMPYIHVEDLVRKNKIFRGLKFFFSGDYESNLVKNLLPLWNAAFDSTTAEVMYHYYNREFSVAELEEAKEIIGCKLSRNVTLVHFLGHNGFLRNLHSCGDLDARIQTYISLNKAKRRKITPGFYEGSNASGADCVEVLSELSGMEREDDAKYFVLRQHPELVPHGSREH